MPSEQTYHLTGGVFFLLVSHSMKKGKTELECLASLADFFGIERNVSLKTQRTNTTHYKKCLIDKSAYLPFDDEDRREVFCNRLAQDYGSVLSQMSVFIETFISKNKYSWLVTAIDDILRSDSSATEDRFHVLANGGSVSYQELLDMEEVEIEPFLTGIWGFILSERPHNIDGASTIRALTSEPDTKGNPWRFVSSIGMSEHKKAVSMNQESANESHLSFVLPDAKIAPELTSDGKVFLVDGLEDENEKSEYDEYFNRLTKIYNKITTLLYADTPQPFYDFYVCNNIYRFEPGKGENKIHIKNVTVDALLEHSNYVLLSGNGGLGKSMMIRHLLLDSVNRFEEVGLLPIFLELRSYTETNEPLADYAYHVFTNHGGEKSRTDFDEMLKKGDILLLCDGLDEVQSEKRMHCKKELEMFTTAFPENMVVVSSRPFGPVGSHASMRRFTVFYLEPFYFDQTLALVQKLKFHEDNPKIKQNFIDALKTRLQWTHHSFIENPLLLTIMMMMHALIGDVPSKMHLFYYEAFQVLARKHDATKGFSRQLATKLDVEEFKEVFSEFCARTYKEGKSKMTEGQMEVLFGKLKVPQKGEIHWTCGSFIEDLTSNLSLMYIDSLEYSFIHRSFQEYFCAWFLSKKLESSLYKLALSIFEAKYERFYTDNAFDMLYDMNPPRIEKSVFIPFLSDLFTECDNGAGYITFLIKLYPEIVYSCGSVAVEEETEPHSFLYRHILKTAGIDYPIEDYDFSFERAFIRETYVELDEEWLEKNNYIADRISFIQEVPKAYVIEMGEPEIVGYTLSFNTETVLRSDKYLLFSERLLSRDFALKQEYYAVREYFEDLKQQYNQPYEDDFDMP